MTTREIIERNLDHWDPAWKSMPGLRNTIETILELLLPEGEMRGKCIHCGECEKPAGEFSGCPALRKDALSSEKALDVAEILDNFVKSYGEAELGKLIDMHCIRRFGRPLYSEALAATRDKTPAPVIPRPEDVKQSGPRAASAPSAGPCNTSPPAPEAPKAEREIKDLSDTVQFNDGMDD